MGSNHIYFERQGDDLMCGQHALNMLVQENAFTVGMLSDAASHIDATERSLGLLDHNTPGQNASDSGFFSIQVLQAVLSLHNIKLVDFTNQNYISKSINAVDCRAFIVNQRQHWFALRKFGNFWFILNSLNTGPKYIPSDRFQACLGSLATSGVTIYHVVGTLADCDADIAARTGQLYPERMVMSDAELNAIVASSNLSSEEAEYEAALELSRQEHEEREAIRLSLLEQPVEPARQLSAEELRQKRIAHFEKKL